MDTYPPSADNGWVGWVVGTGIGVGVGAVGVGTCVVSGCLIYNKYFKYKKYPLEMGVGDEVVEVELPETPKEKAV